MNIGKSIMLLVSHPTIIFGIFAQRKKCAVATTGRYLAATRKQQQRNDVSAQSLPRYYKEAQLALGDISTGTWPSRMGECQI
jgi:hypothetical protein